MESHSKTDHRRIFFILGIFFVAILGGVFATLYRQNIFSVFSSSKKVTPIKTTYQVVLTHDGFVPSEITIQAGDAIRFSSTAGEPFWPASDLHPTHGIYPEFDPLAPIQPTDSWTFQFLKSGRWKFHDHLSPMRHGIITVQ